MPTRRLSTGNVVPPATPRPRLPPSAPTAKTPTSRRAPTRGPTPSCPAALPPQPVSWLDQDAGPPCLLERAGPIPSIPGQASEKLRGDGAKFRDEDHRLGYAMGFLEGDVYAIAHPMYESGALQSVAELIDFLDATYDDPDRKGTAVCELRALRQGRYHFTAHYARFQSIMADLHWNDDTKLPALHDSLCRELQDAPAYTSPPKDKSFDHFVLRAKRLDNQQRRLAASRAAYSRLN